MDSQQDSQTKWSFGSLLLRLLLLPAFTIFILLAIIANLGPLVWNTMEAFLSKPKTQKG